MRTPNKRLPSAGIASVVLSVLSALNAGAAPAAAKTHVELVAFFKEWREFQHPAMVDGVPDYSAAAMKRQYAALKDWRKRLAEFDIGSWTVSEKIDYNLIVAEMNGLEFDHKVLKPWASAPGYYRTVFADESDTPLHEGPHVYSPLELWTYKRPFSPKDAVEIQSKLEAIPKLLAQAKINLTEERRDFWILGIHQKKAESRILETLSKETNESQAGVAAAAGKAREAVDVFAAWLESRAGSMKRGEPLGVANYDWHLKNVHLTSQTWQSMLHSMERELHRSLASLQMERNRNRNLPELTLPSTVEELQQRTNHAIDYFFDFLKKEQIFTVPAYMNLDRLRTVRRLVQPGDLDIFTNIEYRDSLPMKCHSIHWTEKQRLDHEPHPSPIRNSRLLYNIWDGRSEGFATAWEETMLQAGLLDQRPRARELIHIMTAVRAIRGIADLKFHSGDFTLDEAMKYVIDSTPNGWFNPKGNTIWVDLGIYAHQPAYGTTYLSGKLEFDRLMADYAVTQGKDFRLKEFMDAFFAKGVIPFSMIRWEMTGKTDEVRALGLRF